MSAGLVTASRRPPVVVRGGGPDPIDLLRADPLFLMTGVPGVLRDEDDAETRIPSLEVASARAAIAARVIVGGLIPKVEEALRLRGSGLGAVLILGADPAALRAEAGAPGSAGTVLR